MLAIFALRLAAGMLASLWLLSPALVNPRFYRTHFLTALGLATLALVVTWPDAGVWLRASLIAAAVVCFFGSASWSLEGAPGGIVLSVVAVVLLGAGLVLTEQVRAEQAERDGVAEAGLGWVLAGDATSAALLGTAMTAMLMGHSYLIAPAMSLRPLMRLLAGVLVSTALRMLVAGLALWSWTAGHSLGNLNDATVLWLPLRWGLGFVGPLVLVWMAWQAARIRSTQSATGILYVVVIFCFLGELTSQLLLGNTLFTL
jgi:hypothetical protein